LVEVLEGRQLLTASLQPIASFSVPAQMGYQLPLDGSGDTDPSQTYTATSSNPNIKVSVAQGPFWTLTVSHTAANSSDVTFTNAPMTFQLFQSLTPNTVARITNFTNSGYYVGKFIPRITSTSTTPASSFNIFQGGSSSPTSLSSSSGVAPIGPEIVQQLAATGANQLFMANGGAGTVTNDAQFFITNGSQSAPTQQSFDYSYTLFGQLVAGQSTLTNDLSKVALTVNSNYPDAPAPSQPINPVTITSASLSQNNPNGVLLIDTTSATTAGQTANITVTATDPTDHTTATQTFTVTTVAYSGPNDPPINFIPSVSPVSATSSSNQANIPVTLSGTSSYPDTTNPGTFTYNIVTQPAHGTITQFNSTAGTLVYVPDTNYVGPDSFTYDATSTGSSTSAPASPPSLPATVTLNVTAANTGAVHVVGTQKPAQDPPPNDPTGNTGAVHLIDNDVLVVTPLPRTDHGTDNIVISQQDDLIMVTVNGVLDNTIQPPQPAANSLLQIIVFGGKASTDIQVLPDVSKTIPITLDGGHGGDNVIQAGAGPTRMHGWFGHTLLIGGTGSDAMIGRKGFVRFKPTPTTNLIYAGVIKPRFSHRTVEPTGTFYRFEKGRLVPVLTT
jgi:cyclophilin family peptidyl-prolyl cis-trans isomerase